MIIIIINITRDIYRYTYVYRYRPWHRMLIAKDQPCSACIVKHGFRVTRLGSFDSLTEE